MTTAVPVLIASRLGTSGGRSAAVMWKHLRVYLTCYRTFQAAGDSRAAEVLETAHATLQERAAKITDEAIRRSFLENVPCHREEVGLALTGCDVKLLFSSLISSGFKPQCSSVDAAKYTHTSHTPCRETRSRLSTNLPENYVRNCRIPLVAWVCRIYVK
jgi:hypothetical protein